MTFSTASAQAKLPKLPQAHPRALYDSLVEPVQDYASEIWGFKNTEMCNKVHENAMTFYLGVHKFTPLPALYGEMGWIAVKYRHF